MLHEHVARRAAAPLRRRPERERVHGSPVRGAILRAQVAEEPGERLSGGELLLEDRQRRRRRRGDGVRDLPRVAALHRLVEVRREPRDIRGVEARLLRLRSRPARAWPRPRPSRHPRSTAEPRTLLGRVVGPGGEAAAQARVFVFGPARGRETAPLRLLADEGGRFATEPLADGVYLVSAQSDALGETRVPIAAVVSLGEDASPLEVALAAPARIEGRVLDAGGAGVAGAEVTAERRGDAAGAVIPRRVATASAADGAFSLAAGEGRFRLRAARAGFFAALRADVPGGAREVDLTLEAAAHVPVIGRLLGPAGRPLADVPVVFEREGTGAAPLMLRTDGFGELASEAIAAGRYTVSFLEPGSSPETGIRVRLRELEIGADEPLDLRLEPGEARGAIVGAARLPPSADGAPYQVDLRPAERPTDRFGFLGAVKIADDGSFRFDAVPPDRYVVRVAVDTSAGVRLVEVPVVVRPGEEAAVEIRGP